MPVKTHSSLHCPSFHHPSFDLPCGFWNSKWNYINLIGVMKRSLGYCGEGGELPWLLWPTHQWVTTQTTLAQLEVQLAGLVKLKCKSRTWKSRTESAAFQWERCPNSLCPVYSNQFPFTERLVIFMTLILMHQFTSNVCHSMSLFCYHDSLQVDLISVSEMHRVKYVTYLIKTSFHVSHQPTIKL